MVDWCDRSQWWTGALPSLIYRYVLSYAQNHYSVDKLDPERNNAMKFWLRGMWQYVGKFSEA